MNMPLLPSSRIPTLCIIVHTTIGIVLQEAFNMHNHYDYNVEAVTPDSVLLIRHCQRIIVTTNPSNWT